MKAGTLFSGIGAPECAAPDIDWRWCAEIDPFASAVHAARFPGVVNLGDVEQIDAGTVEPVELIVFGSPCQSFSVAGKRLGLDDPRGNLALVGLRLIGRIRPRWVVWENVPGVLSSDGGRDFGAFLGLLGELGYGFAYRILDAQHFGVPQRRRRVFVVGCLGDWRGPAAVLFEPESLRGDSAPRREAGKDAACGAGDGSSYSLKTPSGGCTWRGGDGADNLIATALSSRNAGHNKGSPRGDGSDNLIANHLIADIRNGTAGETAMTLQVGAGGGGTEHGVPHLIAFGGNNTAGPVDVATAVRAKGGTGHGDFESETFIAHSLRADSFDAREDRTGRGTPLVAVTISNDSHTVGDVAGTLFAKPGSCQPMPLTLAIRGRGDSHELEYRDDGTANAILTPNNGGRAGIGVGAVAAYGIRSDASRDGEALTPSPDAEGRIRKRDPGFNVYDECSPTLDGGVPHSVGAFRWKMGAKAHGIGYEPDKTGSVETNAGGYAIASPGMSVRRLTPRECERLQGFPDDFTAVAYRGKPAADGPRYRALGNSMAVPVIGWILQRVRLVDEAAP